MLYLGKRAKPEIVLMDKSCHPELAKDLAVNDDLPRAQPDPSVVEAPSG
jgi:hypothetical protein